MTFFSSLLIHACSLLFLPEASLLSLDEVILEYWPAFLGPSYLQGLIPWYSPKQVPQEAKVCSPEAWSSELFMCTPHCPKNLDHCFMVTAAKAALELCITHQSLLISENKVQHSIFLMGSCTTWKRKLSSMHSGNIFNFWCSAVLSLQQVLGWLKSPMRTMFCEHEAASICRGPHLLGFPDQVVGL